MEHDDHDRLIYTDPLEHAGILLDTVILCFQADIAGPHIIHDRNRILDDLRIQRKLNIRIIIRHVDGHIRARTTEHTVDHRPHYQRTDMDQHRRIRRTVGQIYVYDRKYVRLIQRIAELIIPLFFNPYDFYFTRHTEQPVNL